MRTLKEKYKLLCDAKKKIEEKIKQIYKDSINAPEEEKACSDFLAKSTLVIHELPDPGIKFPIEVNGIHWVSGNEAYINRDRICLVKIRPADEDKTYIGIYLGDFCIGAHASYHKPTKLLAIELTQHNPAIFVPDLNRVVMGAESWWGRIDSEEEFSMITDQDIHDVWYVKLLREKLNKKEGGEVKK